MAPRWNSQRNDATPSPRTDTMTNLQIARAIADAVLARCNCTPRRRDSTKDAATQTVLDTLDRIGYGFRDASADDALERTDPCE